MSMGLAASQLPMETPITALPETLRHEEAKLVRAALAGDSRSFERIVELHGRRVFNYLHQMTRHRQDAEDLTQQTFVKAFQHFARVDPERPFINWLLTIARRTALNHFRASKRWEVVPDNAVSPGPTPAHAAEEQDESDNLWARARLVLTPRAYETMWLRFAENLSTEETARIMGLTASHVKVLVFRARQELLKGVSPS